MVYSPYILPVYYTRILYSITTAVILSEAERDSTPKSPFVTVAIKRGQNKFVCFAER